MSQCERVLLVEADSISSQLLSFSLQREGFEVVEAQRGAEGLRIARESSVDIILSEVLLPDIDGYAMCERLRGDWNTRRIPIVLVTSFGGMENRVRGLLSGADEYLIKPYDVRELVLKLRRLISTYANCAHTNSLTRLPGCQVIQSYIEETCLRHNARKWALLQVDLNHFRAFNQMYGFEAGDHVLRMVGSLLRETVQRAPMEVRFAGHEGRDDFVAVVDMDRAEEICEALINGFDRRIGDYYPTEHRDNTHHTLLDRANTPRLVPRLALSIGIVTADLCEGLSYLEVRETAAAVLSRAKAEEKSSTYTNRRRLAGRTAESTKHKAQSRRQKMLRTAG